MFVALSLPLFSLFLIRCDRSEFAGVSVPYLVDSSDRSTITPAQITSPCNRHCDCRSQVYKPVCDAATLTVFYSPCHAGCAQDLAQCACVQPATNATTRVTRGLCSIECGWFPVFILLYTVYLFIVANVFVPIQQAVLRFEPHHTKVAFYDFQKRAIRRANAGVRVVFIGRRLRHNDGLVRLRHVVRQAVSAVEGVRQWREELCSIRHRLDRLHCDTVR